MAEVSNARLEVTTPAGNEIVMTRVFNAPRQLVWEANTKPEHIVHWMGAIPGWSMTTCEVDLRVGGKYLYRWKGPEDEEMGFSGEYREILEPERLVSTEVFEGPYFEVMGSGSLNTMTLEDLGSQTRLTVVSQYDTREQRDSVLETGMEGGAAETYDMLDEYLQTLQK